MKYEIVSNNFICIPIVYVIVFTYFRTKQFTMKHLLFIFLFVSLSVQAKVTLPAIYSDGMVLQRNQPIHIWGQADPKEKIQILFAEQKQTVKADSKGYWEVNLKALETGGPYQLQIIGKENPISIKDILIGDVWLCSGQSNMQWVVNNVTNAEVEKKNANYSQIRTLNIPRRMELSPKDTISATWLVCSPENVGRFSGVAYFFAKKVYEETNIPIGIINSSWGGTIVETWTSLEAANTLPQKRLDRYNKNEKLFPPTEYLTRKNKEAKRNDYPSLVYNAMIHPLLSFSIKGVLWYQGENNVGNAEPYTDWLTCMIGDWRNRWNSELPFYIIQLPNFDSINKKPLWAEMRDAQSKVLAVPGTHLIVTSDLGDPYDLHPRNKQEVGMRAALQALHYEYGYSDIVSESPMFERMEINGDKVIITFKNTGSGLEIRSRYGCLQGFAIAGEDKKFHWALGELKDNRIVIWSPKVPNPVAVRYNWENNPDGNLYNKDGLPACLFRTDNW